MLNETVNVWEPVVVIDVGLIIISDLSQVILAGPVVSTKLNDLVILTLLLLVRVP
mgnify:FL=1